MQLHARICFDLFTFVLLQYLSTLPPIFAGEIYSIFLLRSMFGNSCVNNKSNFRIFCFSILSMFTNSFAKKKQTNKATIAILCICHTPNGSNSWFFFHYYYFNNINFFALIVQSSIINLIKRLLFFCFFISFDFFSLAYRQRNVVGVKSGYRPRQTELAHRMFINFYCLLNYILFINNNSIIIVVAATNNNNNNDNSNRRLFYTRRSTQK